MAQSYRSRIVDSIVATLNTISVAGGYETNLSVASGGGGAYHWMSKAPTVQKSPFAAVTALSEQVTTDMHLATEKELRIEVSMWHLYDSETDAEHGWDRLDPLLQDATRALLVDPSRGLPGVVIDTRINGYDLRPDTEAGQFVVAVLRITVPYRTQYGRDDVQA